MSSPDYGRVLYAVEYSSEGDAESTMSRLLVKRPPAPLPGGATTLGRRMATSVEVREGSTVRFMARIKKSMLPESAPLSALEAELTGPTGTIVSRTIM